MTGSPLSRNGDTAIRPDECARCGAQTRYPWVNHWIPGATMQCDGENEADWVNGGPVGMPEYVRPKAQAPDA